MRAEHLKRAVIRGKDTFPSVDRAHSSMRDVDGLVKPRLRGRREKHGNRTKRSFPRETTTSTGAPHPDLATR